MVLRRSGYCERNNWVSPDKSSVLQVQNKLPLTLLGHGPARSVESSRLKDPEPENVKLKSLKLEEVEAQVNVSCEDSASKAEPDESPQEMKTLSITGGCSVQFLKAQSIATNLLKSKITGVKEKLSGSPMLFQNSNSDHHYSDTVPQNLNTPLFSAAPSNSNSSAFLASRLRTIRSASQADGNFAFLSQLMEMDHSSGSLNYQKPSSLDPLPSSAIKVRALEENNISKLQAGATSSDRISSEDYFIFLATLHSCSGRSPKALLIILLSQRRYDHLYIFWVSQTPSLRLALAHLWVAPDTGCQHVPWRHSGIAARPCNSGSTAAD
ncbi:unnamed protein product [Calicophoron daubneyi]|uniref:Uncharacterized protein n=1 Tax=Calicophoron daubneyi TaxID=300641 RepID=A0AAV2TKU3_CALDB